WSIIRREISDQVMHEPALGAFFSRRILQHDSLAAALSDLLSIKLASADIPQYALKPVFDEAYRSDESILQATTNDLLATRERDPAVRYYSTALLYFKGFEA